MNSYFKQINMPGVFTITQWNTLADSLSDSFPKCDQQYLKWDYRSQNIKNHLLNEAYADIICLEEVDHPNFFSSFLDQTHQLVFHKKPEGEDGQLVAISKQKFQILKQEAIQYKSGDGKKDMNQSFWSVIVLDKQTNKQFLLLVTHLKAKKQFEDIRVLQVEQILEHIQKIQKENNKDIPIVFAGDFNAEPTYSCIQKIKQQGILNSAYEEKGLTFTTYKVREPNDVQIRMIDYIFFTHDSLELLSIKNLPTQDQIGPNGLPNQTFSGDHLSLTATFKFMK
ncbi:hypothetical protein ABPG72_013456 [Tetrahymena utriculariae]